MLSLRGFALCDLEAPGWGEPWFPHSAVLLFFSQIFSLVARLLSPYQCYLMCKAIFFCSVLYMAPCCMQCFPCFCFCLLLFCLFCFLFCSVVFLVWSPFLFHCMTTAYMTVYWSFISTIFAAHQQWASSLMISRSPCMGSRVLDEPSAEALATVSSSNHVRRRNFTPIALFESVTLMYILGEGYGTSGDHPRWDKNIDIETRDKRRQDPRKGGHAI